MKNDVTFFTQNRFNITGKEMRIKSRGLQHLRQRGLNPTDALVKAPHTRKARTGVLLAHKQQGKKTPKYHSAQSYYLLFKKARIPEHKCKLYSSQNCFGKSYDQAFIKDDFGGDLGNRAKSVKNYQKNIKEVQKGSERY